MQAFNPVLDAVPLDEVRRILVVKLRHHGDVLLTSPVFSALKRYVPRAEVDALVYADTAAMVTLHPDIAEVHRIERSWGELGWWGRWRKERYLLKLLRHANYDLLIHLSEHWQGAWLARKLGVRWSVGPMRREREWKRSFTHRFSQPRGGSRHVVEANLDALRRIGIHPAPGEYQPILVPGREAEMQVSAHMRGLGLENKRFVHIHPASRWPHKCWPPERMAAFIGLLQADGHKVVLTAAPSRTEAEMIGAIQERLAVPVASLAGQLSLKELAALASRARLFVGIDSAPMHVAAAVGTPTVAIFGPSDESQWGPLGSHCRVVTPGDFRCRPCGIEGCGGSRRSDCLAQLPPATVYAAVRELLAP